VACLLESIFLFPSALKNTYLCLPLRKGAQGLWITEPSLREVKRNRTHGFFTRPKNKRDYFLEKLKKFLPLQSQRRKAGGQNRKKSPFRGARYRKAEARAEAQEFFKEMIM